MDKYAPGTRASELRLVEIAQGPEDSALRAETAPSALVDADEFFAEAARELEAGRVDQPLWAHALARAGGDEKLAMPAYLRSRATALRVAKRDGRLGKSSRRAQTRSGASKPTAPTRGVLARANRKYLIWGAGALTGIVLVAALVAMRTGNATQQPVVTAQVRPPSPAAARTAPGNSPSRSAANPTEDFVGRMQALKDAGNWNVLVLYAVEWTRKQPENPAAWKELSSGYSKLRQFDDALSAAKKSVELAPTDPAMWRNLGQADIAVDDLAAAAGAFERASALDDRDVASVVQFGTLSLRIGRIQTAKAAFAKALAARPDDVDALCGNVSVARQEGRAKDADAIILQVKASGGSCRDPGSAVGEAVVATPSANSKAAVVPRR